MSFMISTFLGLALLIQAGSQEFPIALRLDIAPPPRPPLQTVDTGVVLLDGSVGRQGQLTNVRVLQGRTPFVQPSLEAVRQWTFGPPEALDRDERISATFMYRARGVLAEEPYEFILDVTAVREGDHPPVPRTIIDPGYPINSIGQGSVIMQVQVNVQGTVEGVRVVRPEPSLTDAAISAVKRWKFVPASGGGQVRPGSAIVVITFQAPVLASPVEQ